MPHGVLRDEKTMYRYLKVGSLMWVRNGCLLLILQVRNRAFGIFWNPVERHVVLIVSSQIVERSPLGAPEVFAGGRLFSLSSRLPVLRAIPPVIARRGLMQGLYSPSYKPRLAAS
jgi:hypothetical protein